MTLINSSFVFSVRACRLYRLQNDPKSSLITAPVLELEIKHQRFYPITGTVTDVCPLRVSVLSWRTCFARPSF